MTLVAVEAKGAGHVFVFVQLSFHVTHLLHFHVFFGMHPTVSEAVSLVCKKQMRWSLKRGQVQKSEKQIEPMNLECTHSTPAFSHSFFMQNIHQKGVHPRAVR